MDSFKNIEEKFWPTKITLQVIAINWLWTIIAWIVWSIIIISVMLLLSKSIWFSLNSANIEWWIKVNNIFPFFFSLITFIATTITILISYNIFTLINPDRYKKNMSSIIHILFFSIFIYILITPIYLYIWKNSYEDIFYIFLLHNLIMCLWTSLILELLNNYKYILLGFYWSFLWFLLTIIVLVIIFWTSSTSAWKIISFLILLPLINFLSYFFKQIFEFIYYQYYKYTWMDQLWDIFYQIEKDNNNK